MDTEDRVVDIFLLIALVAVIALKISGVITIPWVWLLSPLWIPFLIMTAGMIVITIWFIIDTIKEKRK
jgi:hypothetical protein